LASPSLRSACDRLQQIIFRNEHTFATKADLLFVQNRFMIDLVLTLVRVGRLRLEESTDRAAFRRFVAWLATWQDANKAWANVVVCLNQNVINDPDLLQELMDAVQPQAPKVTVRSTAA
jgi:hypothetical protein